MRLPLIQARDSAVARRGRRGERVRRWRDHDGCEEVNTDNRWKIVTQASPERHLSRSLYHLESFSTSFLISRHPERIGDTGLATMLALAHFLSTGRRAIRSVRYPDGDC